MSKIGVCGQSGVLDFRNKCSHRAPVRLTWRADHGESIVNEVLEINPYVNRASARNLCVYCWSWWVGWTISRWRSSRTGELCGNTYFWNLAPETDRESWFSAWAFSELKQDINIRSKAGNNYNFSLEDLILVIADVDFWFWLRYP